MGKNARRLSILGVVVLGAGLCFSSSRRVESIVAVAPEFRPGQIIVQLKPDSSIDDVNIRNQTTTIKRLGETDFYLLRLAENSDEALSVIQVEADTSVQGASLNRVMSSPFTSLSQSIMSFPDGYAIPGQSSTDYKVQAQALDGLMKLTAAHVRSRGAGTTVAVIDTGIDRSHPVLSSRLWTDDREMGEIPGNGIDDDLDGLVDDSYGWDLVNNDGDPTEWPDDPQTTVAGHGTFIAGLIAVLAPECRIMPLRAFSPPGLSDEFTVAEAIKWAVDHGADVVNMSFGTPDNSAVLQAAIDYAFQQNAVMVAAMGNEATDTPPLYPAHYHNDVMGVTAVDVNDILAFFSNYGPHTSMSAFGKSLVSTYPGADYALWSGTSFAAPLVGAQAALLIAADGNSRVTRNVIEQTALRIDQINGPFAGLIGKGRLRPLHALQTLSTNTVLNPIIDLASGIELTNVGAFPQARGNAEVSLTGAAQELRINAYGLTPGAVYRLIINNQLQPNSWMASPFGSIAVTMSNNTAAGVIQLPAYLQPVTRTDSIEVRDGQGRLVLSGDFDPVLGTAKAKQHLSKEARLSPVSTVTTLSLSAVSTAPAGSGGIARIQVDSKRQVLSISFETSAPSATYRVAVDGVSIGTLSSQSGSICASYSSDGSTGRLLPQTVMPICNVMQVAIIDSSGKTIGQGTFQIAGANLGSG